MKPGNRPISFIHFSVFGLVAICVIGFPVLRRWREESISLEAKICDGPVAVVVVVNLFEHFGIPIDRIAYFQFCCKYRKNNCDIESVHASLRLVKKDVASLNIRKCRSKMK